MKKLLSPLGLPWVPNGSYYASYQLLLVKFCDPPVGTSSSLQTQGILHHAYFYIGFTWLYFPLSSTYSVFYFHFSELITKSGHLDQTLHRSEMGISLRTKSIAFTLCTRYLNKDSMEQDQPKKIECPFHLCNYLIAHASFLIQLLFWHNQFLSACNHSSIRGNF